MNLPNLGAHCSQPGCGQLDFLPFNCDKCHHIYCLAHHKLGDHDCTYDRLQQNQMPVCPICQQFIYVKVDQSKDVVMNAHIASGCTTHLIQAQREQAKSILSAATRCDQPTGCRNLEKMSTLQCAKCGGQFCLTHRLPITHRCRSLPEAQRMGNSNVTQTKTTTNVADPHAKGNALLAKLKEKREAKERAQLQHDQAHAHAYPATTTATTSSSSSTNKRGGSLTLQQIRADINASASAAAAAIANVITGGSSVTPTPSPPVISASSSSSSPPPSASPSPSPQNFRPLTLTAAMKQKALGDSTIPESLRLYLQVDVSSIKSKKPPTLCFFSMKHSIGKVLDLICDHTGIENENHLASGKKLYLCAPRLSATFPTDMTLQLLDGVLLPGDTITLQRQPIQ